MSFLASARALGGSGARLADWLASPALCFAPPAKLLLQRVPGMGVGLVAAEALGAGETVLRVPREVWSPFSAEHALAQAAQRAPPFAARLRALAAQMADAGVAGAAKLPLHVALSLHLIFEASDPSAAGHGFAAGLPAPDAPSLWPQEALAELAGTRTHTAAAARRAFVATVHSSLFGESGGGGITRERFATALAVVLSRALSGASAPYALVPVLDAANHADVPTVAHSYDAAEGAFELRTLRAHAAGEQLFLSYGLHLCNDATLRLYGFATPRNAHDSALLPPPWPARRADDPLAALKARLLARAGAAAGDAGDGARWWGEVEDGAAVPVRGGADAAALLCVLRIMHATPEDVPGGAGATALDAAAPLSTRNEAAARGALAAAARAALRRYSTPRPETERLLSLPDTPPRRRAALAVRAGEQRALTEVLAVAERGDDAAADDAAARRALRAAALDN